MLGLEIRRLKGVNEGSPRNNFAACLYLGRKEGL